MAPRQEPCNPPQHPQHISPSDTPTPIPSRTPTRVFPWFQFRASKGYLRADRADFSDARQTSYPHSFHLDAEAGDLSPSIALGLRNDREPRWKPSRSGHRKRRSSSRIPLLFHNGEFEESVPLLSKFEVRSCTRPPVRLPRIRISFRRPRSRMFILLAGLFAAFVIAYLYVTEGRLNRVWEPDSESEAFSKRPLPKPDAARLVTNFTLPLRTSGRRIVDAEGRRFKLASVNWYGASDGLFVAGGLDVRHRDDIARTIVRLGFNSVRLPYSDELVMKNPRIPAELVFANPDLAGLPALDVFEAVVSSLTRAGLAVIVNNHITSAQWCCGANPCDAGWANDHLGALCSVSQTELEWMDHWETVMARFVDDPLVIGADLRNEVRGLWGTMPWSSWAAAAERCGRRLHKMNPDWLIVIGGTESGNDLRGVALRPVALEVPDKIVYSAHVYSWSGWGSLEGRFAQRRYASFARTMRRNWAYLLDDETDNNTPSLKEIPTADQVSGHGTTALGAVSAWAWGARSSATSSPHPVAPVWVGEFGAPRNPSLGDYNYWRNLMRFLDGADADFGYWALNPRKMPGEEDETYGLLRDDWETPVVDYRMRDMLGLMS